MHPLVPNVRRSPCCRLVVDHAPQDFLYVPAVHAADWMHLAHHFARYGVMAEVAMPQIIHLLVLPGRPARLCLQMGLCAADQRQHARERGGSCNPLLLSDPHETHRSSFMMLKLPMRAH